MDQAPTHTPIGTAKLNDVDPQPRLADVLARIAGHPVNRFDDLLLWNSAVWAQLRPTCRGPRQMRTLKHPDQHRQILVVIRMG